MMNAGFNELKQRGTPDFPVEIYQVAPGHIQYIMPHHWHFESELLWVESGSLELTIDGTKFTANAGDIIWIAGGFIHSGEPENCKYQCIVFDLDFLSGIASGCSQHFNALANQTLFINPHLPANDKFLQRCCRLIFSANNSKGDKLGILGGLFSFFSHIFRKGYYSSSLRHTSFNGKNIQLLKQILVYIEAHYPEALSLESLAKEVGLSPKYFCRIFKEMTNNTPIYYLNSYRIEHACRLLTYGDLSITEVAFSCGFNDLSYFIRSFKKYKGLTPKQFALHRPLTQ